MQIVVTHESSELARHNVDPGELIIGRASSSDIQIQTGGVSRHHARVAVGADGGVLVEDLGSANGTLLGGRLISGTVTWTPGEVLEIGEAQLHLLSSAAVSTNKNGEYAPTLSPSQYDGGDLAWATPAPVSVDAGRVVAASLDEASIIERHLPLQLRRANSSSSREKLLEVAWGRCSPPVKVPRAGQ